MQRLTRFLFGVADVLLVLLLLSGAISLFRIFFAFLDLTFPGGTDEGKQVLEAILVLMGLPPTTGLSVLLLVLALVLTLAYMLSFFLLLQKQVVGLFLLIGLDLIGFLLWPTDPVIVLFTGIKWLILGLPWLVTWIDLKRRGTLA